MILALILYRSAHPASFAHKFLFQRVPGCNSIADLPLKIVFWTHKFAHRVASNPELATNFIDYKQMAGMTTVRKSCYYTVLSRRYAISWIYFYLNILIFEIYTQH